MNTCASIRAMMPVGCGLLAVLLSAAVPVTRGQNIYATFSSDSNVTEYSATGTQLNTYSTGGTLYEVTTSSTHVYTSDIAGGVEAYNLNLSGGTDLPQGASTPNYYGIATDSAGNVYVASDANNSNSSDIKVYRYAAGAGTPTLFADTVANTSFGVLNPIAIDPVTGNVFVGDNHNNQIIEYGPGGGTTPIRTFTTGVSSPEGLAVDRLGNLYVADHGTNSLVKILISSGAATTVGTGLSEISGVATDANNNVLFSYESTNGGSHGSISEYLASGAFAGEIVNTGGLEAADIAVTVPEPATAAWLLGGAVALTPLLAARKRR